MKKYIAEAIGTFAIVFCGTGAIIINEESNGAISHVGIAITFGLIVMAMIYSFGDTSGANFNPAVTVSLWLSKLLPAKEVAPYIVSQLVGAILASGILKFLFWDNKNLGSTLPQGSDLQSFVLEFILTFLLMVVILKTSQATKETQQLAGFAIGMTVLLEAMFAGPICGASMNPARSIGPALISGNLSSIWIYIISPILGAIAAIGGWKATK
ncbi:MAG: MIP family channel protein [Spirosomaceae bacterium]|jgi:aquaporin Z|nr:MIP family channel protein [Spirosomataceae bacterium]